MRRGADAGAGVIELAGIGFAVGDKLGIGLDAELRRDDQNLGRRANQRDRHQILENVVGHRFLQRRIDDDARIHQHHAVAVGRRMGDVVDADDAAGAGLVLGDDRLAKRIADLLRQHAAGKIDDAARPIGNDQVHGPVGEILRMRRKTIRQARASTSTTMRARQSGGSFGSPLSKATLRRRSGRSKAYRVAPCAISSTSSCGVTGICAMRTSNGDSASSIAEITAAAAGMTPTSPTPLTPSGLCGDGDSL